MYVYRRHDLLLLLKLSFFFPVYADECNRVEPNHNSVPQGCKDSFGRGSHSVNGNVVGSNYMRLYFKSYHVNEE